MKIVIDKGIPFTQGLFEPYCEVLYKEGIAITKEDVADADALMIRTRTRCNADLLDRSSVKIIATATIGTDHIDQDYCQEHGICVRNAAGCNAGGVVNYVLSAIYGSAARKSRTLSGCTLGIVGVGSVGGRLEQAARELGFKVLLNDPPRAEKEGPASFCSLDELLAEADIVSMHVPLTPETRGMACREFFGKMKDGAMFINAARGEVVDDNALLEAIPRLGPVVLDTWNGEPYINRELLDKVFIATPHIAGYSLQGKQFGTAYAVRAIARFLNIDALVDYFPAVSENLQAVKIDLKDKTQGERASIIQYNYPIFTDDFMFRMDPDRFEELRNKYSYRREFYLE